MFDIRMYNDPNGYWTPVHLLIWVEPDPDDKASCYWLDVTPAEAEAFHRGCSAEGRVICVHFPMFKVGGHNKWVFDV